MVEAPTPRATMSHGEKPVSAPSWLGGSGRTCLKLRGREAAFGTARSGRRVDARRRETATDSADVEGPTATRVQRRLTGRSLASSTFVDEPSQKIPIHAGRGSASRQCSQDEAVPSAVAACSCATAV